MENQITSNELLDDWNEDAIICSSDLGLRDEKKQAKGKKITRFVEKKEETSQVLLVLKQFAAEYNAKTLRPDEKFNSSNKYRPSLSPTTVIRKLLINKALIDPEYKDRFVKKFKFEPTNEMVNAPLTKEIIDAFKSELIQNIFTLSTMVINDEAITKSQYPKKYLFDSKKELGIEQPVKKIERLLATIAYNQAEEKKRDPEHLKQADNKRKEDIRAIWNARQVQGEAPDNRYVIIKLDLKDGEITEDLLAMSNEDIWERIVFEKKIARDDKLQAAIQSSIDGNKDLGIASKDIYGDFYEITMTITKAKLNDRGEKGYQEIKDATTYTPTTLIKDKLGDAVIERITKALDDLTANGKEDLERKIGPWIPCAKFTPDFEEALIRSISAQLDVTLMRKYLKEDDVVQHEEALSLLGGKFDSVINASYSGDLPAGATDASSVEAEAKQNANEDVFSEDSFSPVTKSEFDQY